MLARLDKPTKSDRILFMILAVVMFVAAADVAFSAEAEAPDSYMLTTHDAEAALSDALVQKGAGEQIKVVLVGKYPTVLHEGKDELVVEIRELSYDDRSLRWDCVLAVHEGEQLVETLKLSGRYESQIEVPVLTQRLHDNDVIEADDIEWKLEAAHRLRKDTVMSANELIGKSPRRVISEQRPIRTSELIAPEVMSKGSMVQMRFQTANMEITTTGEALTGGGLGDLVRVRNTSSNVTVQGRITGANSVEVNPLAELASVQ